MKKIFVLSLLIPFALVCSCQKQNSTAEEQLTQQKAELDAREKALDEREKALSEREKLLSRPRVARVPRMSPVEPQRSIPPELKGLIPDPSQVRADREKRMQELRTARQRRLEELQQMRAARGLAGPEATAPVTEAASPSPTPTPE